MIIAKTKSKQNINNINNVPLPNKELKHIFYLYSSNLENLRKQNIKINKKYMLHLIKNHIKKTKKYKTNNPKLKNNDINKLNYIQLKQNSNELNSSKQIKIELQPEFKQLQQEPILQKPELKQEPILQKPELKQEPILQKPELKNNTNNSRCLKSKSESKIICTINPVIENTQQINLKPNPVNNVHNINNVNNVHNINNVNNVHNINNVNNVNNIINYFKIKQGKVSTDISYFSPFFFKTFNLQKYNNILQPCVFFGCYDKQDLFSIINNKHIKIIIWAGSDSAHKKRPFAKKALLTLKHVKNVFHISISNYILNDLKYFGIKSKLLPFCIKDMNEYNPVIKGNCIYYYTSFVNPNLYGASVFNIIYEKLKNKYKFIIGTCKTQQLYKKKYYKSYPFLNQATYYSNMIDTYKKCFIGLRLTTHDGNANTVQELGMCGIKCFYNGDSLLYNTIKWKNVDDIIKNIENEAKTIGQIDYETSIKVKDYLKPNNKWLDIRNYLK
jgi:hypothetical protein